MKTEVIENASINQMRFPVIMKRIDNGSIVMFYEQVGDIFNGIYLVDNECRGLILNKVSKHILDTLFVKFAGKVTFENN